MYRILIVEDDAGIAEAVSEQAKMWNFETHSVTNFRNVMAEFAEFDPHLVLLDIGLPFFNGYYWCGEIRKVSRVPVIFISSASDNMNIVMAMNMGGDDFVAKILFEIFADHENKFTETGVDSIIDRIIHDCFTVRTQSVQLLQASIAASHSGSQ